MNVFRLIRSRGNRVCKPWISKSLLKSIKTKHKLYIPVTKNVDGLQSESESESESRSESETIEL